MSKKTISAYEVRKMIEAKVEEMDDFAKVTLAGWLLNEVELTPENARMLDTQIDICDWAKQAE